MVSSSGMVPSRRYLEISLCQSVLGLGDLIMAVTSSLGS
jgi:hypothetical protein